MLEIHKLITELYLAMCLNLFYFPTIQILMNEKKEVVVNTSAIVNDFGVLGNGLVKNIQILRENFL